MMRMYRLLERCAGLSLWAKQGRTIGFLCVEGSSALKIAPTVDSLKPGLYWGCFHVV